MAGGLRDAQARRAGPLADSLEPWSPSAPPEAGKPQSTERAQDLQRFHNMADTSKLSSANSETPLLPMLPHWESPLRGESCARQNLLRDRETLEQEEERAEKG
jgi:hypothetical protein